MSASRYAASVLLALLLALLPVGEALSQSGAPIVLAQASQERPGLFRFLFRRGEGSSAQRQQAAPERRQYRVMKAKPQRQKAVKKRQARKPIRKQQARKATRKQQAEKPARKRQAETVSRKQQAEQAARAEAATQKANAAQEVAAVEEEATVEKSPDARRLLVLGDFWGGALAKGLEEAFSEDPDVVVVDATSAASGLVRQDQYDWSLEAPKLIDQHKPAAILVMIGANDRQPVQTAQGPAPERSPAWRAAYGGRVSSLAETLKASGRPVLWSGLVPVRAPEMSRDYSLFNGIFRERLEASGVGFVEVWDGFSDDGGGFVVSGPDMNGQEERLREEDGLNFTPAGARKLAFFFERDLDRILGQADGLLLSGLLEEGEVLPGAAPVVSGMVPLDAALGGRGGGLLAYSGAAGSGGSVVEEIVAQRLGGTGAAGLAQGAPEGAAPQAPNPAEPLSLRR